jgi:hypothetical protein
VASFPAAGFEELPHLTGPDRGSLNEVADAILSLLASRYTEAHRLSLWTRAGAQAVNDDLRTRARRTTDRALVAFHRVSPGEGHT